MSFPFGVPPAEEPRYRDYRLYELVGDSTHTILGLRCHRCGYTTWTRDDVERRFCPHCSFFHDPLTARPGGEMSASLIAALFQLLPVLISAVETFMGAERGLGPQKKQAVMASVRGIANAAAIAGVREVEDPRRVEALVTAASATTDAIVAAFNVAGVFKTTAHQPLEAVAP